MSSYLTETSTEESRRIPNFTNLLLKDKLKHVKIFEHLFEHKLIQMGCVKLSVFKTFPPAGAQGDIL